MFLITHDLDTLYEICDRVAVIADKRVIAVGTIPELLATDHPWIQEYFNGPRGRSAQNAQERNAENDQIAELALDTPLIVQETAVAPARSES